MPAPCLFSKVEVFFLGELIFLCACDEHDDVHDRHGLPDERCPSAQCHSRGAQPLPFYHVTGVAGGSRSLPHEPPVVDLLHSRAGKSRDRAAIDPTCDLNSTCKCNTCMQAFNPKSELFIL